MGERSGNKGQVLLALAYAMATACLMGFGYGFYLVLARAQAGSWSLPFIVGGVAAVAGIGFTFGAVIRRTAVAGEHILFHTWFPMFMALVPMAGPFIALWSAFVLLRNRVGAATITTRTGASRTTRHHEAHGLQGTGRPGGVILVALAALQPLILLTSIMPDETADFLGIETIVNTWDGQGSLSCEDGQIFTARDCKSKGTQVRVGTGCRVDIEACELELKQPIHVHSDARLHIRGGRLQSEKGGIEARSNAQVVLDDVTILAPRSVKASDDATVFITGGMVHGKTAFDADDRAVITLRGVDYLGRVESERDALVHTLAPDEKPEDIVARVRNKEAWEEARRKRIASYQGEACKGFIECYQKNGVKGEVSGEIVMQVGPVGAVTRVIKRRIGPTSPVVDTCIRDLAESKRIVDFSGPTGVLRCEYKGTVTPQSQMLDMSSRFTPDKDSDLQREKVE